MADRPVIFENELIVVQDVSGEMPRHRNWPYNHRRSARYRLVPDREIDWVFWHHTAGGISPGIKGPPPLPPTAWPIRTPRAGGAAAGAGPGCRTTCSSRTCQRSPKPGRS